MNISAGHPILERNNVRVQGEGSRTFLLAHGFACDQTMWRFLMPHIAEESQLVLFDYTGCGRSDVTQFDSTRYADLNGYAQDVIEICDALQLNGVCFVGHSVSATIGMLAAIKRPDLFSSLVLVCPSPCF
ncbi:MAG TPA: alpha/beta hydrolase, partial [Marinobacterium sp.]|nr:alpha/beta hydrolase [Marinobacterium sp.]